VNSQNVPDTTLPIALGVDGLVSHRGVDVAMSADQLGDMGWHAVHHGIGDEDSTEAVRGEGERGPVRVGYVSSGHGLIDEVADGVIADRPVLHADPALEQ
jgi:hypothetical protein